MERKMEKKKGGRGGERERGKRKEGKRCEVGEWMDGWMDELYFWVI